MIPLQTPHEPPEQIFVQKKLKVWRFSSCKPKFRLIERIEILSANEVEER